MEMKEGLISRIGAVNWDCSLPPETYFGGYAARSLSGMPLMQSSEA